MPRTTSIVCASIGALSLALTSPVFGQNLEERAAHVMNERAKAQTTNTSKSRLLGALLYTDVTVQFSETPSRDAIKYLSTMLGVNIIGRFSDDKTGIGIDPEAPITLDATGQPAITVLEFILDQCSDEECTWQLRNGYIEVGTKERLSAKSAREIRYYPIRDLLFDPPRFDNAPELDLQAALDQAGQTGGGGGGGSGAGGGGRGGGGGGGGSGGGGGGGGGLFGDPEDEADRPNELEQAQVIIDIITETIETEAWDVTGGDYATIRYYQGVLIINAPDYIQRQVGGYPFAARPPRTAAAGGGSRYVQFSGGLTDVQLSEIRESGPLGGAASGNAQPATDPNAGNPAPAKPNP